MTQAPPSTRKASDRSEGSFFAIMAARSQPLLIIMAAALAEPPALSSFLIHLLLLEILAAVVIAGARARAQLESARHYREVASRLSTFDAASLRRISVETVPSELAPLAAAVNARLDELSSYEKEQQQFIADVSHELRTPLTILRGTLEVALDGERTNDEYREVLSTALLELNHLSRISQNLLFLARGQAGRVTMSLSSLDLSRFVRDVVSEIAPMASERGLAIDMTLPPDPVTTLADAQRLRQVVFNLFDNAIRYTEPGGSIHVRLESSPAEIRLAVADTGVGIAPEDLPFVFERFFRSDRARRAYRGGTGLGLSIVRWIVEAHKGRVHVESTPGQGSVFTVALPKVGDA
jgi:signal transduction histidine kinase